MLLIWFIGKCLICGRIWWWVENFSMVFRIEGGGVGDVERFFC